MNIFKSFTLEWWQVGLFKWGVFLLGIAAGAHWAKFFGLYIPALLVIAAVPLCYIACIWWEQVRRAK